VQVDAWEANKSREKEARQLRKGQAAKRRTQRAIAAGKLLSDTAEMQTAHGSVVVDAAVLLGTALTAACEDYLAFDVPDGRVYVKRTRLVHARKALRGHLDVAAWLDRDGVHIRWRGGLGGLNFISVRKARDNAHKLSAAFVVDLRNVEAKAA